jgi:hypothetical protein
MSLKKMLFQMPPGDATPPVSPETRVENHRRYTRAPLVLFGTCSLSDATSFPCHTRDLSAGGIAVFAPVHAQIGACASIRLERLGAFHGEVVRSFAGGFAIEIDAAPAVRDRLAEQIAWISTRSRLGVIEDYRYAAERPLRTTALRVADEERVVEVIDMSGNGVAIRTFRELSPGLRVTVGERRGRVLNAFEGGAAIEFLADGQYLPSADATLRAGARA